MSVIPFNIKNLFKNCRNTIVWQEALELSLPKYEINNRERVCAFLAQTGHESGEFNTVIENLNYSATALQSVFKKYFDNAIIASSYARKPEKIANRVYANRMGNGDEASGDGWKYRGRGILQVTGKSNYKQCSTFLFNDDRLLNEPEFLLVPEYAIKSACWFWKQNNLNKICDSKDFIMLTRRINGGTNGLSHRQQLYDTALSLYDNKDPK